MRLDASPMASVKDELWTFVTPRLEAEIKRSIARQGGPNAFEAATGIWMKSVHRVLCGAVVSLTWMDRFCTQALTELWVTDFHWRPWSEVMAMMRATSVEEVRGANGFYEPSVEGMGELSDAREA